MSKDKGILTLEAFQKQHPLIAESLQALARGDAAELSGHFFEVETHASLDGTEALAHSYFIASDGNGRPRVSSLASLITTAAIEYAIPRSRILEADLKYAETGSEIPRGTLYKEAVSLFTDLTKTGEGGELLLYLLAERVLKLPQIISKMSLKTSSRLHYQGADGVHADVNTQTGMLNLYWCESKIYKSIVTAITDCFKSIAPYLLDPYGGGSAQSNDIRLLNSHVDLGNKKITEALKQYLNPQSPYFNKVHNCGICLVGGNFDAYPNPGEHGVSDLVNQKVLGALVKALPKWKKHALKRIGIEKIQSFSVHLFFLPFPNVDEFRKYFLRELGIDSNDE